MALLIGRTALAAACAIGAPACYSPDLASCTVECASDEDCGGGQICGADRFCATPDLAGTCARAAQDAPNLPDRPDAAQTIALTVKIEGLGRLAIGTSPTCMTPAPNGDDKMHCGWNVAIGTVHRIVATPASGHRFEAWTSANCKASTTTSTCTLVFDDASEVAVRFEPLD